jgi:hypothetical protein
MPLRFGKRAYQVLRDTLYRGPLGLRETYRLMRILERDQGHAKSRRAQSCIDAAGQPIPWFTYPAIEYLRQLDLRNRRVFEWGSGNSSLFFARRSQQVHSVEHDRAWAERGTVGASPNLRVEWIAPDAYAQAIDRDGSSYDLIIIDAIERLACASAARRHLAPGGFVILDNADWFPGSARALREAGLLQVDMHGFGPINDYAWTTSLFFTRECRLEPLDGLQPHRPIGGLGHRCD